MQPDLTGDQIHVLIVVQLQIDDAALAEARHGNAGLRVERDETISGRDVEDALFTAVGPISQPATGEFAGAASPRAPSFSLCIQISSPVAASSATTARRVPAVA